MVDYSKWKDIEISDDEDETHPNIDTPSLFRWRHQARVERMEEMQKEKETFESRKLTNTSKLKDVKEKISKAAEISTEDKAKLEKELVALEKVAENLRLEEESLKKKEKKTPWNVDTISKPGFAKTVINKPAPRQNYDNLSEEEKEKIMKEFVKKNEKLLKQYGILQKYEDSKRFLQEHHELVCENTANYLVIWCINLQMEEKHELMCHVAHQCISMQYILELSKQLDVDPRSCVASFFTRIKVAEIEYKKQFDSEVAAFIQRIEKRAQEKIDEAIAEQEEEERAARLGPGGLDPVEVYETLPDVLKQCFDSRDISLLQEAITQLPEEEAKYHMKRCVDSGLWIPDANKNSEEISEGAESTSEKGFAATKVSPTPKGDDLDLD